MTGYTYYKGVANLEGLMAHIHADAHGNMPECESFKYLREGDEELIKGEGYIAKEEFDFTEDEWNDLPDTLREALNL